MKSCRSKVNYGHEPNARRPSTRAILHLTALAKGKSLCAHQLLAIAVLNLAKASFARVLVLLVVHEDIVLREAARTVAREEGAVASIEYVYFWIRESRVMRRIDSAIPLTDERRPITEC